MEDVMAGNSSSNTANHTVQVAQIPLSFAKQGETVKVLSVRGKGDLQHHLENLGFTPGAEIKVVCETAGNLIVEIKGAQVALNKDSALKVITTA